MNLVQMIGQARTGFWRIVFRWFKLTPLQATELFLCSLILFTAAPSERSILVGGVVAGLGITIRLIASGYRYSEDSFKVRGPYRYVRHPHHLGSIVIGVGFAVAGQNLIVAIFSFASLAIFFRAMIIQEERRLARSWGPRYAIFRANVSAIIPQLIPFVAAGGEGSRFSLKNSLVTNHYREINKLVLVFGGFLCLYWTSFLEDRSYYIAVIASLLAVFLLFRGFYYGYAGKNRGTRGVVSIVDVQ
jgi:protein-S-isoprenylcysteine O-methyltransferase Ste14